MKFGGTSKQKKATLSGHPQISAGNSSSKHGNLGNTHSGGCCRGLNDCMIMGSAVSTKKSLHKHKYNSQQSMSKLVQQIADLEREVQNQKEHKLLFAKRTERTQDYLRYCLRIAQDNGFLHLIINDKDDQHQVILSSDVATSPLVPSLVRQKSDLASIIDQAKLNGWYINPLEIELQEKLGQGSTIDIYRGTLRGLDVAVKCVYPDYFHSNANGVSFLLKK